MRSTSDFGERPLRTAPDEAAGGLKKPLAVGRPTGAGWAAWEPAGWHHLREAPWADRFPYIPEVSFCIAWGPDWGVGLRWRVREKEVRAVERGFNGRVWEDSCVEFFWAPGEVGERHYAFEFNPAGAVYGAVCDAWREPVVIDPEMLGQIEVLCGCPEPGAWSLAARIPAPLFGRDWAEWRHGNGLRANFYKCGDGHADPHYLCWNRVEWPRPSFHRPCWFGVLAL